MKKKFKNPETSQKFSSGSQHSPKAFKKSRQGSGRAKGEDTHWDTAARWYDALVGEKGTAYQQEIIFPGALRLMQFSGGESVLDLACGQGVFSRELYRLGYSVTGVDASSALIQRARQHSPREIRFYVGDARTLSALKLPDFDNFDRIVCLLAIQNMDPLDEIFRECALRLKPQGRLVLMMMHPCFRIPRQSHWGYDAEKGSQYRRIERYQSELKIPILTHPGKDQSLYTWSFHRPLSLYFKALAQAHFVVEDLEEFISSKTSEPGPRARAENRAREEIPLFLGLRARKESAWLS